MKTFEQAVHDLSLPGLICSMALMLIIDRFGRDRRERKLRKERARYIRSLYEV